MNDELNEIPGATPDFRTELAEKLANLVPEAVADGKIDTKKLEELLDGDAADARERFGLFWPGKKRALRAAQEPTTATLVPDKESSKDWDTTQNVFIEGDNLEVLKILQKHYHGKIDVIYIDPPYNTGGDFVYPDNYQEGLKSYLEFTKQVDEGGKKLSTNSDQAGRYHSNWLNMMYPRLKLARNLLSDEGFIYISIDDAEQSNLKKLADEIFGERNFIAQIVRNTNSSKNQSLFVSVSHDYCLVYARNIERLSTKHATDKWGVPKNNVEEYKKRVRRLQAEGLSNDEITVELKNLTNYPRFIDFTNYWYFDDRGLYRKDNLGGVKNGNMTPLFNPLTGADDPVPPGGYRYSPEKLQGLVDDGRIHFHTDGSLPTIKRYLHENDTQRPKSIMSDDQRPDYAMLQAFGTPFDNPKQLAFLKRIFSVADKDAVFLDFFSGSASTGHAVMELNAQDGGSRRHIQVQLPEPIAEDNDAYKTGFKTISALSRARLDKAGQKILEEVEAPQDLGYRSFRLADTSFAKWRLTSDVAETELEQHLLSLRESADDKASQEALLTELLLKRGYSLTEQVDVFDVAGLEIHGVKDDEGDYGLLAYLNEHQKPSLEQLRALVDAAEAQIVILEDAFQGDDQLKTNLSQLCKSKGVELWTA